MAAARLGFPNLYAALHDQAPDSLKSGLEDGSAWPLRTLLKTILPIVLAARAGDQFTIMDYLKVECPLLQPERIRNQDAPTILQALQNGVNALVDMLGEESNATIKEILTHVRGNEMLLLDERFNPFLEPEPVDDGSSGFKNLVAFLECGATELWAYRKYIEEESPFATQQGVKGAQFERVLVIVDEEEGSHSHFSYGKYFEFVPLSEKDEENIEAGIDSVLDRTRRLFYVCCSRAVKDLAVVIFTPEVDQARAAIERGGVFPPGVVLGLEELLAPA
jgi:DNA helicase-2/ATP-dependent DNA helicase PcrA